MPSIIDLSDDLRSDVMDGFTDAIPGLEKKIRDKIMKILDGLDTSGDKFTPDMTNRAKLASIQAEIEQVLKDAGYFKAANIYIRDLAKITENTIALHSNLNKINPNKTDLTNLQKVYADKAVSLMSEGGLSVNFVQPVTDVISEALSFGYSISDTRESLSNMIVGNEDKVGKLKSYLTTTARDTVTQLQGAQHKAIQQAYELNYIRYVGSIIKDSRGQCRHWKQMQYIAVKDLQAEIDEAFKKQDRKFEEDGAKWGGMIEGTNADNFIIRRGGWACRHQAIPVRSKG